MEKIQFLESDLTAQDSGGNVETMVVLKECFAWARPTSSNRTFLHVEGMIIDSYNFDIYYQQNFTPTKSMTIQFRNRRYAINGITELQGRRRMWRIFAISES